MHVLLHECVQGIVELDSPEHTSVSDRQQRRHEGENAAFNIEHYAADYAECEHILPLLEFIPSWEGWFEGEGFTFTEAEQEMMRQLPRKEYLVSSTKTELIGLVDIIYAWCYDHRTTMGDPTVESAWTIAKISSTLSYLVRHRNVRECAVGCFRRALS